MMDPRDFYAVFLVFIATLTELTCAQYSVESVTLSTQRALVGDNLMATCEVRNEAMTRMLVYWVRKIHDHDHEVEISTNGVLNDNFKHNGRYGASYETVIPKDIKRVRFYLNITNVKTEDSGHIGCRLMGPENERFEMFKDFIVSVPVQKVTWVTSDVNTTKPAHTHTDGSNVEMREDQIKRFVCNVNGSFPKPEVRVYVGDQDITSQFKHHAVLVKGGGPPGLQPLYYKVEVSNDALKVDYSFNDKSLRCVASLQQSDVPATVDAKSMQKSASMNITLLYKPKFLCSMQVYTKLNEPNYNLICKVHSNPEVKLAKVHWTDPNDTGNDTVDTLGDGMKSGDFEANVTMVNELETVMVLTISRVFRQHFKTYVFEAENDLGRVTHEIELKEEMKGSPTSAASSFIIGLANLVASIFLVNLLSKW